MSRSRLHQLSELGQSVWIDFLSRKMLQTGELERMMREDAVVGVTSNPTIFQKAISEGDLYDEQIRTCLDETDDPNARTLEVLAELTIANGWQGRVTAGHTCALASYPRNYASIATAAAWIQHFYGGSEALATSSGSFTAVLLDNEARHQPRI